MIHIHAWFLPSRVYFIKLYIYIYTYTHVRSNSNHQNHVFEKKPTFFRPAERKVRFISSAEVNCRFSTTGDGLLIEEKHCYEES